jgi:hypothetical protein
MTLSWNEPWTTARTISKKRNASEATASPHASHPQEGFGRRAGKGAIGASGETWSVPNDDEGIRCLIEDLRSRKCGLIVPRQRWLRGAEQPSTKGLAYLTPAEVYE